MRIIFSFLIGLVIMIFSMQSIYAASPCQGLSQDQCVKKAGCTWVKSFMRKGKKVSAYCRAVGTAKKKGAIEKSGKKVAKEKAAVKKDDKKISGKRVSKKEPATKKGEKKVTGKKTGKEKAALEKSGKKVTKKKIAKKKKEDKE
jgi:hypothetical protein